MPLLSLSETLHTLVHAYKKQLRSDIAAQEVDLPVTHSLLKPPAEGIETWLQKAMAQMLIEFMAAFARKDYEDRRERQAQGIAAAKKAGRLQPRQPNLKLYARIIEARKEHSIRKTAELLSCSKGTVERAQAWEREKQQQQGATV